MAELEKRVVVALFQGQAQNGDVGFNLDKMKRQIARAASVGAEMILFPELFLSGYCVPAEQMRKVAEEKSGPSFQELSKAAKEANIAVLYGYPEVDQSSGSEVFYNSAQLIDQDGSSLVNYSKTHLWLCPEPPQYEAVFTPGSHFQTPVECCGIKIGIVICMDFSLPECARCLAVAGAQLIAVPTASTVKWENHNVKMIAPVRAIENSVYIANVNHVGDGFEGCSICCDPDGDVVVFSGSESEEALLLATVVVPFKAKCNTIRSRRPDLYEGLVKNL